jgi:translation initiation factor 2B subunit (eIF-2B alpha/beta/delta family)
VARADEVAVAESLHTAATQVRDNRTDGASQLARNVAAALERASARVPASPSDRLRTIQQAAQAFAAARPSMAAVANTAARIWHAGANDTVSDPASRLRAIHRAARALRLESGSAAGRILRHSRPLLPSTLYTLSRSGTVEAVLLTLGKERAAAESPRIVVGESRPGGEGVAAARALAPAGWQVILVPDTACGLFIAEAAAVVLGADSVRADGSIVNKVGSYPLALVAHAAGVPVYVLCETIKIASPDFPLHFEEMEPRALLPDPIPSVTARNVYFDRTPAELITSVISECGPLTRDGIARIAADAQAALTTLSSPLDSH